MHDHSVARTILNMAGAFALTTQQPAQQAAKPVRGQLDSRFVAVKARPQDALQGG